MKICSYCGTENANNAVICENCDAHEFKHKCNNCGTVFAEGEYCPKCGVKAGQRPRVCPNCGREYYSNACPTCGYVKGGNGSTTERTRSPATMTISQTEKPVKKRKTWLWVLGWLFIFPLPLTILLVRNKRMNKVVKIIILVIAWLFYLLIAFAGQGSNETSPVDSSTKPVVQSSDTSPENQDNPPEPVEQVNAEADNLKQVFLALSSETSRDDIDSLAKQYGMYSSNRNTGTGTYVYRIAATKDIASVNTKAKGSFVSISFNALQNNAVTEITYFDVDSMIGGFWYPEAGYSVVDYNVPQIVFSRSEDGTERRSCMTPVDSANDIVTYVSTGHPDGNLLAQLFMSAHDGMTEEEIKGFISDNGLAYTSRGPGNEQTIAYSEDIVQKYGNDGSKITFDTDANGLTRMIYYYYPSNYRQGYSAAFYSGSYATSHSLKPGFQLVQPGADPLHYDDASQLLQALHGSVSTQVIQAPSYSEASTPDEMITSFANEFNANSTTALEFVEAFTPSDRESGHYRTEFRLGAYSEAVGMSYRYGEATVDIIARKPTFGNGVIRIYMDGASLEQCEQMIWTASPIMDRTAGAEDVQTAVDYVDERKEANGYYYSNLGLVLLGSDVKGYNLMIKMGND